MKTTLNNITSYKEALDELSTKKVTAKVLLAVLHNTKVCENLLYKIEEVKSAIQKRYASVDENGNLISDEDGQLIFKREEEKQSLIEDFSEALLEEIDVDIQQVTIDDLINTDVNKYDVLTPAEVQKLNFMILE